MDGRHNRKITHKSYFKLLMVPLIALLAFLAVMTGVQAGNLLYRLDANLVKSVDAETFRDTIRISLPIIENVYNNGKSSTSFTGEIKSLFTRIFEFDLDSPVTILNVQSPIFKSYYNRGYKALLVADGNGQESGAQKTPDATGDNGTGGDNPGVNTNTGEDGKGGTGNASGGSGKGAGSQDGTGEGAGKNPDNSGTGDSGNGTGSSGNGTGNDGNTGSSGNGTGNGGNTGTNLNGGLATGNPIDLQPISSISYEPEDEEENQNSDMISSEKVAVQNFTKHKIDIAHLLNEPLQFKFDKKGPKVLIYHTHTTESYVLQDQDLLKKNIASYNSNPKYNVVRVGEELSQYLKKYGIDTLHNATVHDKVRNAAYGVAINTLLSYKKSYPSIKVFIDLHRDGLEPSKPKLRITKKINGKTAAQVMFVVGTDDMLPNPYWEENLKFVLKVQQKLNEKYPGLARPVMLVGKRYNQQVSNPSVLIEIGGDGNLLSECVESARYVADALNDVMKGK